MNFCSGVFWETVRSCLLFFSGKFERLRKKEQWAGLEMGGAVDFGRKLQDAGRRLGRRFGRSAGLKHF